MDGSMDNLTGRKVKQMNRKLHRVLDEIRKTENKIAEWQEHLKELNLLAEQLENEEIIKTIRSMKLDSRRMLELLEGIQEGTVSIPWPETEETLPEEGAEKGGGEAGLIEENKSGAQETAPERKDRHEKI